MKNALQRFGKFLSAMVMPNIGAFIAWGLITALFIADGWLPNERLASIQPYMLTYLLPILIAAQGGYMVGGDRGRIMGTIAVIGCIAGVGGFDGQPMLMGAMVVGPVAGLVIKKFDKAMEGRMPAGFEMLINNFSVGILGMVVSIIAYYIIGPFMSMLLSILSSGVAILVQKGLLPLVSVFLEPAKVLFLNNAINHGVFTPIGLEQAQELGKSIMFMLEPNPGPGLGVLIAYWLFSKDRMTKDSAPGAILIHFLGGIHEIYFPYILMNPIVIIAPIVGNAAAIFFYSITNCGLVGSASPGSIIAYVAMSPRPQIPLTLLGVVISAGISFLIASPIIKMAGAKSLEDAQGQMAGMKAEAKGMVIAPAGGEKAPGEVKKVVFACDAGMGSSAMGATKFRNRVKGARPDLTVINTSVDNIPSDCDIAVVQITLVERAQKSAPQAQIITIGNFLADPNLDALYNRLTSTGSAASAPAAPANASAPAQSSGLKKQIMVADGVRLNQKSVKKEAAIQAAGELMVKLGYVGPEYVEAMQEREKLVTTYMGMGIAIPHGTTQAKGTVKKTGIVLFQYPNGVDFGDEKAYLVFGIAGIGDEHLDLLAKICETLESEETLQKMKSTNDVNWILQQLT